MSLFAGIVLILLLAIIAYHRFQVQTKKVFFSIFPIYTWVSVDQPILFNHIHHKEAVGLNCTFCHRYVERYRSAGIPNIELCRACHATDAMSKSCHPPSQARKTPKGMAASDPQVPGARGRRPAPKKVMMVVMGSRSVRPAGRLAIFISVIMAGAPWQRPGRQCLPCGR